MSDEVKRCPKCTEEVPRYWVEGDPCYACSTEQKKMAAMIAMDEFLSEPNHDESGSEWPDISREELTTFWSIVYDMVEAKWGIDCDHDRPVQVIMVNRKTHGLMHYDPIPHRDFYDKLSTKEMESLARTVNMNVAIAQEQLGRFMRGLSDYWGERRRAEEENDSAEAGKVEEPEAPCS